MVPPLFLSPFRLLRCPFAEFTLSEILRCAQNDIKRRAQGLGAQ